MVTQSEAARYIESHGHRTHIEPERIVAECQLVLRDGRVAIEYETFMAPYSPTAIRDWLGY